MTSSIAINDKLVEQARKVGRHRTQKGAVTAALKEYIKYRKQLAVLELAGKVDFDPEWSERGRSLNSE